MARKQNATLSIELRHEHGDGWVTVTKIGDRFTLAENENRVALRKTLDLILSEAVGDLEAE